MAPRDSESPDQPGVIAPDQAPRQITILETDVPLSQSLIWRLQSDFYVQRGLKAWTEDMVPSYITNNPFIAEIYAQIVAGFLLDCMNLSQKDSRPLSPENPLRILELGAGTGKFSYLFLRKLAAFLQARKIPPQIVRYSMADCSESLLAEWRGNRYLGEFVNAGILEFQLHRAEEDTPSAATNSRVADPAQQTAGPLVVIANYVFDSLPQDAFIIADGQISEAMVTTSTNQQSPAPPLSSLQLSFKNVTVPPERYPDKSWNDILEHYRNRLPAATVLFPSAALRILQQLSQSSDGRMLVLAADKGFVREEDLALLQGPPQLEFHASSNCFSQTVNFDAITRYFYGLGGDWLLPQKHFSSLSVCAFIARHPGEEFPATRKSYEQALAGFGPDDLFALMSWLNAHLEEVSVVQALALLRLTRWDPTALLRMFPVIARQLRVVVAERHDLRQAVLNTWANHYPVSPAENLLAFNCAVILLELRFFAEALPLFKVSEQVLGRTATTSYNMGLCALGLGRPVEALAHMVDACNLDPGFEPASSSRARLEKETAQS
ncbi:MAG TPA: SAM-dependent methyltransferase [Candidatus Angelobacter sp.]|nr:SAM-dependent methyltransferase [Candidatus Angelobacter sp.]